ncbi:hypothetical protein HCN44_010183 [Aphidius gifuensis]|uniref:SCA7 domain-containing protein n=1 Tax=Aphidius gifuensis TaxID=684658 RepID=A0A835CTS0_APHGI|nr:ataxin-7-like protein 1 [Aphidius gifuensis]KAF7993588.1 hypothetical protein HCN44_010183 [Aphidius gifuensis]
MSGSDSPTFFHGQPWSNWIEKIGRDKPLSDDESETEPSSVTRLSADDIDLYGFCPERDTFYGVVCEICNAIVKPQALIQHMESRHSSETANLPPPPPPPPPSSSSTSIQSSKPVLKTAYCKISKLTKKSTSSSSSGNSTSSGSLSNSKINHTSIKRTAEQANLHSTLQTIAPKSPYDQISGIVPSSPVKSPGTNGNTATTTSTTTTTSSTTTTTTTNGPPKRKRLKGDRGLLKDREYDADKHCGVWNDDTGKPCTRSLTCKAHTVSLRRTVPGRSKSFDKLLAEHRASKDLPNRTSKVTVAGTITVSTPTIGKNINNNNINDNESPSSPPVLSLPDSYPLPKTKLEEDFVKEEMRLESSLAANSGLLTKSILTPISVLLPSLSPITKTELSSQVSTLIPATISPIVTTPLQINNQLPATVLEGETLSDIDNESMTLYSPVSLFKDTKSQIIMQIPRSNSHNIQSPNNNNKNYQIHGSSMPNITFDEPSNSPKNQLVNGKRISNNDNNSNSILLSPLGGGGGSSSAGGGHGRTTKRIKHEYTNEFTNIDGTTGSTSYPHYGDISWSNCHPEPLAVSRWLRITSTRKQYNFNIH